jgi:hypothetical protein
MHRKLGYEINNWKYSMIIIILEMCHTKEMDVK